MRVEDLSIAVRSRSISESYDLALHLARAWAWPLGGLVVVPSCLAAIASHRTLVWLDLNSASADWFAMLILLAGGAPLVTAPATAFLGAAMFTRRPSVAHALKTSLRGLIPIAILGSFVRILSGLVLFLPLPFCPMYVNEVVLLEQQPIGRAWRRAGRLMSRQFGVAILHGTFLVVAHLVFAYAGLSVWDMLTGSVLSGATSVTLHLDPTDHPYPWFVVWLLIGFLGIVRFATYIDLRAREEGWELQLDLLRAAREVDQESSLS